MADNKYLDKSGLETFWSAIKVYISNLKGTATGSPSASKTLTAFTDAGGQTTVTFADIAIAETQVTNLTTDLGNKAPLASPALTGTPTAPTAAAGTNTTQIATTAFVKQAVADGLADTNAMIYKGTLDGGSTASQQYGSLTPAANKGDTYKVKTAGSIDGVKVEIGDMLICNTDNTAAATASSYTTIKENWDFIQGNIDGAVSGPESAVDAHVAVFDGTTGKTIKDSGYTIATSVPANAVFTDTDTKVTSVDNHYAPAENADSAISAASGSATQLPTSSTGSLVQVVTGLKRDAKGHVVGVTSAGIWSPNSTYSNASLGQGYGTCATAEATAAKVVTLSGYALATGGIVAVKFTNGLCASATLNINSKGAKAIYIRGAAVTATTAKEVLAGDIAYFIYDGTQYQFLGTDRIFGNAVTGMSVSGKTITITKADGSTSTITTQDTTYSDATTTAHGLMTAADKSKLDGIQEGADAVSFTQGLTAGTKVGTININGTDTDLYAPTNTDTKVTSVDNHYAPAEDTSAAISATGGTATKLPTTTTGTIQVVTGVKRDAKGHIVGVTSAGLYAQDTTYTEAKLGQGYGTCTTAAATAAKAVTLSGYELATGGIVAVKFTYALCAAATLNINSKGAKAIFINGAAVTATTATAVQAGDVAYFIYDGTQYQFLGTERASRDSITGLSANGKTVTYTKADGSTGTITTQDTTYSDATTSAHGLMTAADKTKLDGIQDGADSVSFTQGLSAGTKVGTININGTDTDLYAPTNTDTKVTSAANHYSPSAVEASKLTASATGATAAWSIDVVKAVEISRDDKGHVTGLSVTSGKIPGNPNTDTKVKQTAKSDNVNYKLLASAAASPTSGTAYEAVYDTEITMNPSTNTIAANISGTAAQATADGSGNNIASTYQTKLTAITDAEIEEICV